MTRPTTRSKNKRQRPDDTEDILSEILRKIHVNGEISESDIYTLYMVSKEVCEGCRTNLKDSPNCFCGLIPAPNGTRKTGLWQKMSEIISSLGPNPCKDLRSSTDTPAGLTNLGATCYANSILQCLYMNTSFRSGIFSVDIDLLSKHPVLDQLSRLFAQLHSCTQAFIDSDPFIKTLELDNGVQQDSHEFLTLFLSLLERSLSLSKSPKSRNMIQDLFRGRVSHVTRCSVCGRDSEASSKLEDFYELELNIKGLSNLSKSLEDYLSVEELHGENQYLCESCGVRIDATRSIKLRELPSVLNFQLKRYVFLPKSNTKKKISSTFSFPGILDMSKSLTDPSDSALIYDLSAILIHKGTAANSGHYIAHIKDENTGQWWEFDDEHVSKLGFHPFGDSSKSTEKSVSNENNFCKEVTAVSNGAKNRITKLSSSDKLASTCDEIFSSSDAYMLMYNRKKIEGASDLTCKKSDSADMDIGNTLPIHLYEEIHKLNASYANSCEEYQLKKDACVSHITERRQEVRLILSEAPVHSLDNPYFWISTDWLRQWADNTEPSFIDNSKIQCTHGNVPFQKVPSMKRVSEAAWCKLLSKYGGAPTLSNESQCIDCIKEGAKNAICVGDYRDRRALMSQLAKAALAGNHLDDNNLYYVSKAWLIQWLRRKNVDSPCEADAGPTTSLRCPHGGLLPEQASGAKRVLITENLWLFYCESANVVKPDDAFGCMSFPADFIPCEECSRELTEVASHEDNLRAIKLIQREKHNKLISGKSLVLELGCRYFLVPSSWLANWRAYVTTTGKNISSSAEPENLGVLVDSLICDKHSRLLERPCEVICKRRIITQKASSANGLTLIPQNDWKLFCEEWNVTEGKGISAEIHLADDVSSKEVPISPEKMDEANDELDARIPIVKTNPETCEDCIGEQESCELMRKFNYCDEDIRVFLVSGKEAPKSLLEASWTNSKPDRRISKRSRRSGMGNSVSLKVSCSTSIYQLKMMIWESFGVVKENQQLHKGSLEIEDDLATLADKNIFPGDILWVKDTEFYENRDIADELSEEKNGSHKAEEGFRGSLLTSGASVQVLNLNHSDLFF